MSGSIQNWRLRITGKRRRAIHSARLFPPSELTMPDPMNGTRRITIVNDGDLAANRYGSRRVSVGVSRHDCLLGSSLQRGLTSVQAQGPRAPKRWEAPFSKRANRAHVQACRRISWSRPRGASTIRCEESTEPAYEVEQRTDLKQAEGVVEIST